MIDQAAARSDVRHRFHFVNDLVDGLGAGFDRPGQRIAAERAEAHVRI